MHSISNGGQCLDTSDMFQQPSRAKCDILRTAKGASQLEGQGRAGRGKEWGEVRERAWSSRFNPLFTCTMNVCQGNFHKGDGEGGGKVWGERGGCSEVRGAVSLQTHL